MRLLLIHSDFIEYEVKKRTPVAEDIEDDTRRGRMEDALTAFVAVEEPDEADIEEAVSRGVHEIETVAQKLGTRKVVLYPYAHLSSSLSSPEGAR
ncbi:MAG: threonyl-tRNA synthetase editing domain-containing protein, partial [Methermicoccaceae archaeon]